MNLNWGDYPNTERWARRGRMCTRSRLRTWYRPWLCIMKWESRVGWIEAMAVMIVEEVYWSRWWWWWLRHVFCPRSLLKRMVWEAWRKEQVCGCVAGIFTCFKGLGTHTQKMYSLKTLLPGNRLRRCWWSSCVTCTPKPQRNRVNKTKISNKQEMMHTHGLGKNRENAQYQMQMCLLEKWRGAWIAQVLVKARQT